MMSSRRDCRSWRLNCESVTFYVDVERLANGMRAVNEETKKLSSLMFSPRSRRRKQAVRMSRWRVLILKSGYPAQHVSIYLNVLLSRGDLQVALDLYRKAENYVPDNVKLKERWILFVVHVFLVKLSSKF